MVQFFTSSKTDLFCLPAKAVEKESEEEKCEEIEVTARLRGELWMNTNYRPQLAVDQSFSLVFLFAVI